MNSPRSRRPARRCAPRSNSAGRSGSSIARSPSLDQYRRWRRVEGDSFRVGGITGGRTSTSSGRNGLPSLSSQRCVATNSTRQCRCRTGYPCGVEACRILRGPVVADDVVQLAYRVVADSRQAADDRAVERHTAPTRTWPRYAGTSGTVRSCRRPAGGSVTAACQRRRTQHSAQRIESTRVPTT